jgi:AcrR family transcriptional regulator
MTGHQRREQLVAIARSVFAEKGFEPASVEEIAARAEVSKPVVYEHFGGKEGIYAVVVDREVKALSERLVAALTVKDHPRRIVERTALALLDYIEEAEDGFRILVRDSPVAQATGPFNSMLGDLAKSVEDLLRLEFEAHDLDPETATLYAQMLVGMIAFTGQWWLEAREPDKRTVAAHLTNLGWNGLRGMERAPRLNTFDVERSSASL